MRRLQHISAWGCREREEPEAARPELDQGGFVTSLVAESSRYIQRYVGHANMQTDIKEVTFMGSNDELVAAGKAGCIAHCACPDDADVGCILATGPGLLYTGSLRKRQNW